MKHEDCRLGAIRNWKAGRKGTFPATCKSRALHLETRMGWGRKGRSPRCRPQQRSVVSHSYDPMEYSLPGSSVHGILQARILEWVHFLLQGIFPAQGWNLDLLHFWQTLYCLSH